MSNQSILNVQIHPAPPDTVAGKERREFLHRLSDHIDKNPFSDTTSAARFDAFEVLQYNWLNRGRGNRGTPFDATILVPKNLRAAPSYPVHVRFHGGDFCTGDPQYKPWFPPHAADLSLLCDAITIMPEYRKMPESGAEAIFDDVECFWGHFKQRAWELDDFLRWEGHNISLYRDRVLVSGDGAGAMLAIRSWLWHQKASNIKALFLQSPLFEAPASDICQYLKNDLEEDQIIKAGEAAIQSMEEMKRIASEQSKDFGLHIRPSLTPPEGLLMASYLRITGKWKKLFLERPCEAITEYGHPDIMDRLQKKEGKLSDADPFIAIIHGGKDTFAPPGHVNRFVDIVQGKTNGEREDKIVRKPFPNGGHGFDHDMSLEDLQLPDTTLNKIKKAWLGKSSSNEAAIIDGVAKLEVDSHLFESKGRDENVNLNTD
ncbi:alpha/beta-hydrolase [Lophiostoma macrostomum CBS 122681]|uniref:Alpha/beta-hydrolase n=1 Tax=Lophiostoma macrostomum CBS 122681 TaxID=1314788 RepID=A0A6A6SU07_9PLEO|nr:alpha/beta-hydrolase [Lophiostoma macrostomum CBS 122681]